MFVATSTHKYTWETVLKDQLRAQNKDNKFEHVRDKIINYANIHAAYVRRAEREGKNQISATLESGMKKKYFSTFTRLMEETWGVSCSELKDYEYNLSWKPQIIEKTEIPDPTEEDNGKFGFNMEEILKNFATIYVQASQWRDSGKLCDFTIKVQSNGVKQEFPVHKLILCSECSYFESLFSSDLKENRNNTLELDLDNLSVDIKAFRLFLDWVYRNPDENTLSLDELKNLYKILAYFGSKRCLEDCSKTLLNSYKVKINQALNDQNFEEVSRLVADLEKFGTQQTITSFLDYGQWAKAQYGLRFQPINS